MHGKKAAIPLAQGSILCQNFASSISTSQQEELFH
jgi:hypothetical protein